MDDLERQLLAAVGIDPDSPPEAPQTELDVKHDLEYHLNNPQPDTRRTDAELQERVEGAFRAAGLRSTSLAHQDTTAAGYFN